MTSDPTWAVHWLRRIFPFAVGLRSSQQTAGFHTNTSRRHLFMRTLNRAWLLMALVALLTLPFHPADLGISLVIVSVGVALFFMIRALLIRDQLSIAAVLFTALVDAIFLAIFVSLAEEQGWQLALIAEAPTLMLMGLAVICGGALLGGLASFVVAGVNSALLIGIVIVIDSPDPRMSIHMFWWMLAVIVWLYEMTLLSTFAHLHAARTTLETTVEERTAQLKQALNQIEAILNHTSDVIVLADAKGDILKANPAFDRLFGAQIDHAIENLVYVIAGDDDISSYSHALISVMHDAQSQRIEAQVSLEDGQMLDADLALAPVQLPDGAGVLLNLRDITYLKEIDRFKTRFVANAAHDLSNPLAALKSRLYMLRHKPEQLDKHLVILEQQTGRMEQLIGDLRMLSALDRGVIAVAAHSFDFNTLVARSVEGHQAIADEKSQQLSFVPTEFLPPVYADPNHCERVIVNLIMNALHYTPSGGQISVCTDYREECAVLRVQDTGIGISPDDLPHIFERFYRSERAKLIDVTGTGLGLAIVKEMSRRTVAKLMWPARSMGAPLLRCQFRCNIIMAQGKSINRR